jgi:hypothetical protein
VSVNARETPHGREQLAELEGLREDRVRLAEPVLCHVGRAGDEHDRDRRSLRVAFADQHVASLAVQVDVEEDDVDVSFCQCLTRTCERVGLQDLVSVELEVDPTEQPNRRIVVDDEDPRRRRMPPRTVHRRRV